VDLHLVEPAGVDRGVHQDEIGVAPGQPIGCFLATVGRANGKETACSPI
jgi:hypothetical protein